MVLRTFELTAHLQKLSRTQGRSATAAAAYRSCGLIRCERARTVHDFRRKSGLEASGVVLPMNAPDWALNRARLWNAAELRERNGDRGPNAGAFKARAVTAREIMFGFPAELSKEGRLNVAGIIARHLADNHKLGVDFSIHAPGKGGDERNHHCHMMMTTRRMDESGLCDKAREWDDVRQGKITLLALRAFLAQTMNDALEREGQGQAVRVEHKSLKARGSSRTPQRHMGPGKTHALRTKLTREHAAWAWTERDRQAAWHKQERAGIPDSASPAALALSARHQEENTQLEKAIKTRRTRFRASEAMARQQEAERHRNRDRTHGHEHERGR